jgi:hypothetical protein
MFIVRKQEDRAKVCPIRSATTNELLRYEESINGDYKNIISELKDAIAKQSQKISALENATGTSAPQAKITDIDLLASAWQGDQNLWSQVVKIPDVTPNSKIDLLLNVEQLEIFWNKNIGFVTENINGVITIYAIGQKPTNDYTFQVSITEVNK